MIKGIEKFRTKGKEEHADHKGPYRREQLQGGKVHEHTGSKDDQLLAEQHGLNGMPHQFKKAGIVKQHQGAVFPPEIAVWDQPFRGLLNAVQITSMIALAKKRFVIKEGIRDGESDK